MLVDDEQLHRQLADPLDDRVRAVYLLLAQAKLPDGFQIRPASNGYIQKELRFEIDERWLFSAVLNKSWVLWYFRKPAFTGPLKDAKMLLRVFPNAELNNKNEVKIRLRDLKDAYAVLGWVQQNV
ncbi:hypothetical protein EYF88_15730 [Paracoccus sediminis]|uniref:YdhG-like domain-containing protein n=1 Tax=Paracoccus sediminis TaxID=1214787 RepID=A0ABY1YGL7_9RHOB|nr:hypothetical protein [Paracoccus sediminis]TBN46965.1 hypothetical protein EYF88_15730 [Paracoccus sediminis]